jgi:hypothetical protein
MVFVLFFRRAKIAYNVPPLDDRCGILDQAIANIKQTFD